MHDVFGGPGFRTLAALKFQIMPFQCFGLLDQRCFQGAMGCPTQFLALASPSRSEIASR